MFKHSSHGNRGGDLARKCALRLYRRSLTADDQICAFETVFADGPRLIGAVDALGRVARGENGPLASDTMMCFIVILPVWTMIRLTTARSHDLGPRVELD